MNRPIPAILLVLVAMLCVVLARADQAPTLTDRIAVVLLAAPRHSTDTDEDPRAREARLRSEAAAISSGVQHAACRGAWKGSPECRPAWRGSMVELSAAVLAVREHESHGARYVVEGRCADGPKGARCDDGRARTVFQLWEVACPDAWKLAPGSDGEMRAGAYCAAKLLASAARFCSEPGQPTNWSGGFGRYAARSCEWSGGAKRLATMRRLQDALQRVRPSDDQDVVPEVAAKN